MLCARGASLGVAVVAVVAGLAAGARGGDDPLPGLLAASWDVNEVIRFDPNTGEYLGQFTSGGDMVKPAGMAFGLDGNLYVSSWWHNAVFRYDGVSGEYIDTFLPDGVAGLKQPGDLIFHGDGMLYVLNEYDGTVRRFDPHTGAFLDVFASLEPGNTAPAPSMGFEPGGHLLVNDWYGEEVVRFDGATGRRLGVAAWTLGIPQGLAITSDGFIYVGDYITGFSVEDRVVKFSPAGDYLGPVVEQHFSNGPLDLSIGPDGNLYVADELGIEVFTLDGVWLDSMVSINAGTLLALAWMPGDVCDADFNGDGGANTLDVLEFLNAWSAGDPRADFNSDGAVNTQDVLAFLNAWTKGC